MSITSGRKRRKMEQREKFWEGKNRGRSSEKERTEKPIDKEWGNGIEEEV